MARYQLTIDFQTKQPELAEALAETLDKVVSGQSKIARVTTELTHE